MLKVQLLIVFSFFAATLSAQTRPVSMAEAIQTALAKNPRTQANSLRLQSAYESLRASKKSLFSPTLSLGYNEKTTFHSDLTQSGGASININLFNGLSDYYRLKAQECNYKKLEAVYNSTTALSQNSNGQIAGLVSNYFINLVFIRESLSFAENNLKKLNALTSFVKTNEQKVILANAIQSTQISFDELKYRLEIAVGNYEFAVNDKAPAQYDSLLQTIEHIVIPIDP
ncbi:MAG: TolC family protein, partial [Bdellovibrionaceae bacterium]|nr:TolC family protein [Pseudobdellovibrionaceae bacterium]